MITVQRTFAQGDRVWYLVEGEAGAITFFTQPARRDDLGARVINRKRRMAGDLGTHRAATEPEGDEDFRYMDRCAFTTSGCRYDGFQSGGMLDILADEGEDSLFARLRTIYEETYA